MEVEFINHIAQLYYEVTRFFSYLFYFKDFQSGRQVSLDGHQVVSEEAQRMEVKKIPIGKKIT